MNLSENLTSLVNNAKVAFRRHSARSPRWLVAAPGRVNVIGEHTDYNDGFVLPMAIDKHVVIAADRPTDAQNNEIRIFSVALQSWATFSFADKVVSGPPGWSSYLRGVVAEFLALGANPGPFEAVICSDLDLGGGLSSSAALEVAMATLIEAITDVRLKPLEKALLCQKAENQYAGVPCGIMDQCSSVMGQAGALLLLDCRTRVVQPIPLEDPGVAALIVNSNVKRELAAGEYAVRRRQCEEAARALGVAVLRDATLGLLENQRDRLDNVHYRRARHVVTENARTVQTASAIERGEWDTVGQLMYASHASLRDDYEVSCRELDLLVDLAASLGTAGGVIGARMTGGGFGGCIIALVRQKALVEIMNYIKSEYVQRTGLEPTLFATEPAEGARVLDSG